MVFGTSANNLSMKKDLAQLFEEYIDQCKHSSGLRSETIRSYKEAFRHFSVIMSEILIPQDLSSEIMAEFFKRIRTRERIIGKNTLKIGFYFLSAPNFIFKNGREY